MTVALGRVIGFAVVAVLIFMIVSMIVGAHRTVLDRPVVMNAASGRQSPAAYIACRC